MGCTKCASFAKTRSLCRRGERDPIGNGGFCTCTKSAIPLGVRRCVDGHFLRSHWVGRLWVVHVERAPLWDAVVGCIHASGERMGLQGLRGVAGLRRDMCAGVERICERWGGYRRRGRQLAALWTRVINLAHLVALCSHGCMRKHSWTWFLRFSQWLACLALVTSLWGCAAPIWHQPW